MDQSPKLGALLETMAEDSTGGCIDNINSTVEQCYGEEACILMQYSVDLLLINDGELAAEFVVHPQFVKRDHVYTL